MLTLYTVYFAITLLILGGLITMILKIGAMMGACPITNGAARSASITIATGYAAIGLGGVSLAGVIIPALMEIGPAAILCAVGFASMALGLGFTQAMGTLRAVVAEANPALKAAEA